MHKGTESILSWNRRDCRVIIFKNSPRGVRLPSTTSPVIQGSPELIKPPSVLFPERPLESITRKNLTFKRSRFLSPSRGLSLFTPRAFRPSIRSPCLPFCLPRFCPFPRPRRYIRRGNANNGETRVGKSEIFVGAATLVEGTRSNNYRP